MLLSKVASSTIFWVFGVIRPKIEPQSARPSANTLLIRPIDQVIGLMSKVFTDGLADCGSILGRITPKTQKMVLDAALFNTKHYKVRLKGKVEQSRERSSALPYTSV